ncbi:Nucleoid-associated protein YgaU, contains BON and LysM domains [Methylobacterium sp. 174MFSha1.1]|uniref:LysM peptidoglycan-binding domain-containing protein n=1 Tax=Methylobacterium sp. 174MFSha1.1 TaxID=1502749 RepID=UPI0008F3A338|nr:Ig-like domain-containing protein [Methylobacterium sp. 174MFSha1.1]SFV12911.1 Nucleoid-associated protein YgaU, contains BON and LysM domains [Methylobacterium sp. 174MFSha1.1]
MMARSRRILVTALLGVLVGLGVIVAALLGRPARKRIMVDADPPAPARSPVLRVGSGGRALAVAGLASLLLLAGLAYRNRDAFVGLTSEPPAGTGTPLALLSPPGAGVAPAPAPTAGTPTAASPTPAPGGPARLPAASPAPSFDVVRVEPNGDAVIAGQAAPYASVEVLVDGRPAARARAGADGTFTVTPPPLATGSREIGLRATDARGDERRSPARVAVVVAPDRDAKPLVALTSPDRPTVVLSQPESPTASRPSPIDGPGRQALRAEWGPAPVQDAPRSGDDGRGSKACRAASGIEAEAGRAEGGSPSSGAANPAPMSRRADAPATAAAPPKVVSIDAGTGGSLFVTARAEAGASLRLYLNETLIAPATIGRDGIVTFTIGQGVKPGSYRVRLDLVDPATGQVRDRAEVPFTAPDPGHHDGIDGSTARQNTAHAAGPGPAELRARAEDTAEADRERRAAPAGPPSPFSTGSVRTGGLAATAPPRPGETSSEVSIPGIETVRIVRGDSLWRISRRTYGEGERYSVIYDANQAQIRDPDLIYPGQVLVLPNQDTRDTGQEGKRE